MKKTLFSIATILLTLPAISYAETKEQIIRIIEATPSEYCNIDSENVRIIHSGGQIYALYGTFGIYYPDYSEQPCSGGSGTYILHLAKLERINGKLRANDTKMLEAPNINTRFINTDSMKINNGIWTFTNLEYGEGDANCCPRSVYFNQVRLSDMKLLNRKFIGRKS